MNAQPATPVQPTVGTVTQPTCTLATGSFAISNYNTAYTYNVIPSTGVTVSGAKITAPAGNYIVTATLQTCTLSSATVTVDLQPATPVQPTLGAVTQPTCTVATGSFAISNYNAAYTYTVIPSTGVTVSGANITAPTGSYAVTATLGACTSVASATATVNAQPATPVQPTVGTVTQPTCTVATGSFAISNYNAAYTYNVIPSTGVTVSGANITAPAGSYTLTATLGTCASVSSGASTVNVQPTTPIQPTLGAVTQPTCTVATGSFAISNYNAAYTYTVIPSTGVTVSGANITAPTGSYAVTATLGACTSVASATATVNAQPATPVQPTLGAVTQPTCTVPTGSFAISNYNGAYTYNVIPSTGLNVSGANITAPAGTYTVTATLQTCTLSSATATVNVQPATPVQPTLGAVTQSTCSAAKGSFTITNYNAAYTYNVIPSTGVSVSGANITTPAGSYTVMATLGVCTSVPSAASTVNVQPATPTQPTLGTITQPTCAVATGSFAISNYNAAYTYAVKPSTGVILSGAYITAPTGSYTVTAKLGTCETTSIVQIINPIPPQIQFQITGDCENKEYILKAFPLASSYDPNNVSYEWKDKDGMIVGTLNVLNVSDLINSNPVLETFPVMYTLTVKSTATGCETPNNVSVQTIYCNLQKGISPEDGNGSNEYFDLTNLNVKKLEIFNRYGIKVYTQSNYTNQWKGETDKGDKLPSATYYYVMEFNNGQSKTGWIYVVREK